MSDSIILNIGNRSIICSRPDLGIFAEGAERVRKLRLAEFDNVLAHCGTMAGEELHTALSCGIETQQAIVTDREILDWLPSPVGEAFLFWCSVREFQSNVSEEDAAGIYASLTSEQIEELATFFAAGLLPSDESESNEARLQCEVTQ